MKAIFMDYPKYLWNSAKGQFLVYETEDGNSKSTCPRI